MEILVQEFWGGAWASAFLTMPKWCWGCRYSDDKVACRGWPHKQELQKHLQNRPVTPASLYTEGKEAVLSSPTEAGPAESWRWVFSFTGSSPTLPPTFRLMKVASGDHPENLPCDSGARSVCGLWGLRRQMLRQQLLPGTEWRVALLGEATPVRVPECVSQAPDMIFKTGDVCLESFNKTPI